MTDLLPPSQRGFRHMAHTAMRATNFAPDLPPLCTADFIEDRHPRPMRVLCLGMPRTGTMSLGAALAALGYRCYNHLDACGAPERDMRCWVEALDGKFFGGGRRYGGVELGRVLRGYDAVADTPAVPYFAEELLESFPDAKVILTERPVDDWIRSISTTIAPVLSWRTWPLIAWADDSAAQWHREATRMEQISHFTHALPGADDAGLREHYTAYYARIREICPPERLLEFQTGVHGYKELCAFLGVEAPEAGATFPRVNESKTFVPTYAFWWWWTFRIAATKVLGAGLVGSAALWLAWRRRWDLRDLWTPIRAFLSR